MMLTCKKEGGKEGGRERERGREREGGRGKEGGRERERETGCTYI